MCSTARAGGGGYAPDMARRLASALAPVNPSNRRDQHRLVSRHARTMERLRELCYAQVKHWRDECERQSDRRPQRQRMLWRWRSAERVCVRGLGGKGSSRYVSTESKPSVAARGGSPVSDSPALPLLPLRLLPRVPVPRLTRRPLWTLDAPRWGHGTRRHRVPWLLGRSGAGGGAAQPFRRCATCHGRLDRRKAAYQLSPGPRTAMSDGPCLAAR